MVTRRSLRCIGDVASTRIAVYIYDLIPITEPDLTRPAQLVS